MVHVISSEFGSGILKISPKKGLIEGLAVAADWGGEGLNRHQWSKTILLNNENINVQDLLGYRFFYEPASTSYTLMGSFSKFLIDKYGIEKFKNFYNTGDTEVYNLTEDELVSMWVKYLNEEIELPKNARKLSEYKFSEKSLFEDTCPRETELLLEKGSTNFKNKNYKNAIRYFKEANDINKNNPNTISALAYAYYYDGNYDELMNLDLSSLSEVDSNIINNLRYNVFWDKNGYNYAYNFYKKLSEKALPEDIKRSLDIKLELRNFSPNIRELYKEYIKKGDRLGKIVALQDLISEYRSFSPGYYLLGRLFLQKGDYIRAKKNFSIAERKGLPTIRLRKENLKMLGLSLYASGNYLDAKRRFEDLIKIDSEKTYINLATDFINRSEWALQN